MSGFTLIELMIVVAIASVLLAITIPISKGMSESQDRSQCVFHMRTMGQALLSTRNDYQGFPRDYYEIQDISDTLGRKPGGFGGCWNSDTVYEVYQDAPFSPQVTAWQTSGADGIPDTKDDTYYPGAIGIYSLYYLTEFADRMGSSSPDDPVDRPWFRGGNYLRELSTLHCPVNPVTTEPAAVNAPLLDGYNNYDRYYRRDWFNDPPYTAADYTGADDRRNLVESAYPPADTLITFCPYHRKSTDYRIGKTGDQDVVLFADGAVMMLPAYPYDLANLGAASENPAAYFSRIRAARNEED